MGNKRRAPNKSIRKRRRKKRKSGSFVMFFIVFIIIAGCSGYVAWHLFLPSNEYQDFHTYYNLPAEEILVVMQDKWLDKSDKPIEYNGTLCFPAVFVKENIDEYIYWDEKSQKLTVTMPDKVLRFMPEQENYYENGNPAAANAPMVLIDNIPYLPTELLTQIYHISLDYSIGDKIVTLNFLEDSRRQASVISDDAVLRFKPDKKEPLSYRFSLNETVDVFSVEGDYTRVRAKNGLLGYVLTSQIALTGLVEGIPMDPPIPWPTPKPIDGKVNLLWDQISGPDNNVYRQLHDGLDVLSPTWFKFNLDLSGDIVSLADMDYVNWAHEQGYQVWALISDFSSDTEVVLNKDISGNILPDTDKREHVIRQLMQLIEIYNLDGINIDFEYIQQETTGHYVQFFRELSPYMKSAGAVLSVDMYNPTPENPWSIKYYNRTEVGKVVDYVCVMAYDETEKGGPIGPNASLPFVRNGIEMTLEEVPKEKVILGLPYYVRSWREEKTDNNIKLTSDDDSMRKVNKIFEENNADITWDSVFGTYYATYSVENVSYKAWLEEERSIEEKLKLMRSLDLAGVGGWSRGMESEAAWELVKRYTS